MPRSRIPTFARRLDALADEAGLPRFDSTDYDLLQDIVVFLWHDHDADDPSTAEPKYVIAVPLAVASINGMTVDDLRSSWDRKFGPDDPGRAEAA